MQEKQNIGSLFNRIAGSYDLLNHLFSLNIDKRWRRKTVKQIEHTEANILDVAIGTADFAIELVKQKKAKSVVGIDLSDEMMRIGAEKVAQKRLTDSIHFQHASALSMPFDDKQFDVVTCSFGVRNFSDLQAGLKEMYRVLKTDGELMILEFSYPTNPLIAWLYDFYFSHIMPRVGRIISKDKSAYTYLNKSVKGFIWGEDMQRELEKVGFQNVTFKPLTFGIATYYHASISGKASPTT